MISYRGFTKRFGGVSAVDDLTLDIAHRREILVQLGSIDWY